MSRRPPRLGLVGVGHLGQRHARVLAGLARAASPALRFAGVFDIRAERARAAATAHGTQAFASADELYAACDAVAIAVPTVAHRAVAERALAAGCHLLIEKPLADTLGAADEILAAAGAGGRKVYVGHSERFNPALRAAAGHFHTPRYLESQRLAGFAPRGVDVDVVLDLMIHDIDLVLALTGEAPSSVTAVGVAVLTEREDLANARLEFPSGAVANLTASRISPESVRKLRVFSDRAYLSLDCLAGTAEAAFADPGRLAEAAHVYAQHASHAAGAGVAAPTALPDWTALVERVELPSPGGEPLALELEAFARACAGEAPEGELGRALPLATGADGRRALAVAEAVRAALRERAARWRT